MSAMQDVSLVHVEGPLYAPVSTALRTDVQARLDRGERRIALDLAEISQIDAGGLGELAALYSMTAAVNGVLTIANAAGRVREFIDRVGLLTLLSQAGDAERDWQVPRQYSVRQEIVDWKARV
jgi:anti-anti-sigma factor